MENKNYDKTITVNASAAETMNSISRIDLWWRKDFSGSAAGLNTIFRVPFGEPAFVDFRITELVPNKKLVWKVIDCYLPWFKDKKEWNDTEVVFQLREEKGKTQIDFTHIGLVPDVECYEACVKGWDGHINALAKLIDEGVNIA